MNQKGININNKTTVENETMTILEEDNLQKTEATDNKTTITKNNPLTATPTTIETDTHKNKNIHNIKNHVIKQPNSQAKSLSITMKY